MKIACRLCGKLTVPAFGTCAECIQKQDNPNDYVNQQIDREQSVLDAAMPLESLKRGKNV